MGGCAIKAQGVCRLALLGVHTRAPFVLPEMLHTKSSPRLRSLEETNSLTTADVGNVTQGSRSPSVTHQDGGGGGGGGVP